MFKRKGLQGVCVRCDKVNKVHNAKNLVVKDKTSIEFTCECGQHNVMHLDVVRRRINKKEPVVNMREESERTFLTEEL